MVNCSDPIKEAARRKKLSDAHKGKKLTEETKQKMSAVRKGRPHSKEHSENIGKALKGRTITPEWREKLRLAAIGRKASNETKQKMSDAKIGENNNFFGKSHSQETCGIMSKMRIESGLSSGKNNPAWKGGISFFPYCYKFNEKRKQAVRNFFGNLCICCGKHAIENILSSGVQRELSVHHIDHDKQQGCGGRPFNLVPMCVICHSKEQHYEEEYKKYINKILEEGFEWGIWSKEQYLKEVMYPE